MDRTVSDSRRVTIATGASGVIIAQLPAKATLTATHLLLINANEGPCFASMFWSWTGSAGQSNPTFMLAVGWLRGLAVGAGDSMNWQGAYSWNTVNSPEPQLACNIRNDSGSTVTASLQWTVTRHD